jgi:DNA-binding PadR family transcriptional regulator
MRRKEGALIPIEVAILSAGLSLLARGEEEFHGYQLAREIKMANGDRYRTAAGTLYRALDRMDQSGLLTSRWEDPSSPEVDGRPPRRLYHITAEGRSAYARAVQATGGATLRPGVEPA